MRFGDRFRFTNAAIHARRNAGHARHLAKCKINKSSDIYRYIVDDLFHDSNFYSVALNDPGIVEITLRNVFALDRFTNRNQHSDVKQEDFKTTVTFNKVANFIWHPKPDPEYYLSEIDRLPNGLVRLDIYCRAGTTITRVFRIDFATVVVEDIMPRLKRRFSKSELRDFALWP